jgi:hypothetical protein
MNKSFNHKIERRRFPRVMAPVLYHIPKAPAEKRRISNLSLGGVRIYSDERLDTGQVLDMEFFLPNGSVLEAKARVVWVKELPPGSKGVYDVGMELIKLSGKARKELALVLKQK